MQSNRKWKYETAGCIYRHPRTDPTEFDNLHFQKDLDTLAFENKYIFLLGDFNINIPQYDNNKVSQQFLDKMHSNFLLLKCNRE